MNALRALSLLASLALGLAVAQPASLPVPAGASDPETGAAALRAQLAGGATLEYSYVDLQTKLRSVITLRQVGEREYERGNGTRLRDLNLLVSDTRLAYSPPIPLAVAPLSPGQKWRHSGTVSERLGIRSDQIASEFLVVGSSNLETALGPREAVEVLEKREYSRNVLEIRRYFDARTGAILKEMGRVIRVNRGGAGGGPEVTFVSRDYDLDIQRMP